MKLKVIPAALLAGLLLLSGCSVGGDISSSPSPTTTATESPISEEILFLRENFPTIDGSTSLIPLDAGVRAAIFGTTFDEERESVVHTTSHGSFTNLISGNVDMIYTVPLSEDQYAAAADAGITLELEPVSLEGFVFVVNASNPVSSLTQEQLRRIYSGEITNWSEVGGNDAEIIAYQRNNDSGSQNFMTSFMGDTPLIDAPVELRPASMSGLMDVIAAYDNAENAIGYSVYTYAADMYYGGDSVKFIQVDGVAPSKATMASGEYPLTAMNYAVFSADQPEDSAVRKLCEWIQSDDGQLAVAQSGCVTLRDIGYSYDEGAPARWSCTGTGVPLESTDAPAFFYRAQTDESQSLVVDYTLPDEFDRGHLVTGVSYSVDFLADKELEAEVNDFIAEAVARCDTKAGDFEQFLERLNSPYEYELWQPQTYYDDSDENPIKFAAVVDLSAKNGWLSVAVVMKYYEYVMEGFEYCYYAETAVYDLETGERVEPSDLFYEGVDAAAALSEFVARKLSEPYNAYGSYYETTGTLTSLAEDGWAMTAEKIYLMQSYPEVISLGTQFALDELDSGIMCTEIPRSMDGMFTDGTGVLKTFTENNYGIVYEYVCDDLFSAAFLEETGENADILAAVNSEMRSWLEENLSREVVQESLSSQGYDGGLDDAIFGYDWTINTYGTRWALFRSTWEIQVYDNDQTYSMPNSFASFLYDLTTGERVQADMLLVDGWREHSELLYPYGDTPSDLQHFDPSDGSFLLDGVYSRSAGVLELSFIGRDIESGWFTLEVDYDYIVWQ